MSKRELDIVASTIRSLESAIVRRLVARRFATVLAATNPRFSTAKWFAACNASEGV